MGQGTAIYFLLRSIIYSSQGRDAKVCFGLCPILFGGTSGTVGYFFTPNGTGHIERLEILRYRVGFAFGGFLLHLPFRLQRDLLCYIPSGHGARCRIGVLVDDCADMVADDMPIDDEGLHITAALLDL